MGKPTDSDGRQPSRQQIEKDRLARQRQHFDTLHKEDVPPPTKLLHCSRCQAVCLFVLGTGDRWSCAACEHTRPLIEAEGGVYRGMRIRKSGRTSYAIYSYNQRVIRLPVESLDAARIVIDVHLAQDDVYTSGEATVKGDRSIWRYAPWRVQPGEK